MNHEEKCKNLRDAFASRVSKSVVLSDADVEELLLAAPIRILLYCFNVTGKFVLTSRALSREFVMSKLRSNIAYKVRTERANGNLRTWRPMPAEVVAKLTPKPQVTREQQIETLRLAFQNDATYGTWTLSCEDCELLLQTHSEQDLLATFKEIGRYDDYQQQECFDQLSAYLDHVAWETATAAL